MVKNIDNLPNKINTGSTGHADAHEIIHSYLKELSTILTGFVSKTNHDSDINSIRASVQNLTNSLTSLESKVPNGLSTDITNLKQSLSSIQNRIDSIEGKPEPKDFTNDINEINTSIGSINTRIQAIESLPTPEDWSDEFAGVEDELSSIKNRVHDLEQAPVGGNYDGQISDINDRITTVTSRVSTLENATPPKDFTGDIDTIKLDITNLKTKTDEIAGIKSDVSNAVSRITALETATPPEDWADEFTAVENELSAIKGRVQTLEQAPVGGNYDGQINDINDRIDSVTTRIQTLESVTPPKDFTGDITQLKTDVTNLKTQTNKIASIETSIEDLDSRLDLIEAEPEPVDYSSQISTLNQSVDGVKDRVTTLEAKPAPKDWTSEVSEINTSISAIESDVTTLKNAPVPTDFGPQITTLQNDITSLKSRVKTIEDANYGGSISTLSGRVTSVEGTTGANTTDLTSVKNRVTAIEGKNYDQQFTTTNSNVTSVTNRVSAIEDKNYDGQFTTVNNNASTLSGRVTTNEGIIAGRLSQTSLDARYLSSGSSSLKLVPEKDRREILDDPLVILVLGDSRASGMAPTNEGVDSWINTFPGQIGKLIASRLDVSDARGVFYPLQIAGTQSQYNYTIPTVTKGAWSPVDSETGVIGAQWMTPSNGYRIPLPEKYKYVEFITAPQGTTTYTTSVKGQAAASATTFSSPGTNNINRAMVTNPGTYVDVTANTGSAGFYALGVMAYTDIPKGGVHIYNMTVSGMTATQISTFADLTVNKNLRDNMGVDIVVVSAGLNDMGQLSLTGPNAAAKVLEVAGKITAPDGKVVVTQTPAGDYANNSMDTFNAALKASTAVTIADVQAKYPFFTSPDASKIYTSDKVHLTKSGALGYAKIIANVII